MAYQNSKITRLVEILIQSSLNFSFDDKLQRFCEQGYSQPFNSNQCFKLSEKFCLITLDFENHFFYYFRNIKAGSQF